MNLTRLNTIKSYPIRDNSDILKILLKDRTTRKNIIWATDSYQDMGEGYQAKDHIKESLFKNGAGQIIKPRVEKDDEEQSKRTRGKGEVFTPTWIIKKKIDLIEEELSKLDLEDYIGQRWLEITCGEAPYMTSRYDTVTGEYLDIEERVGFLDRKLQRISKEIESEEIWYSLALKAYQASYGYEYQGDSLLIARENLLNSFIDYYVAKFNHIPGVDKLEAITRIISYNVFQMDGLKYRLPIVEKIRSEKRDVQLSFFGDMEMEDQQLEMVVDEGEEVKVKNWVNDRMIKFKDLVENKGGIGYMKFDVVIGNPPYQDKTIGDNKTYSPPIYNYFLDSSYNLADKVIMIHPARFLFNAGSTPKAWNKKMLKDENFKIVTYVENSKEIFSNTDIKGGVAISYRDKNKKFGAIDIFIPSEKLKQIVNKVYNFENFIPLSVLVYAPESYKFTDKLHEDFSKAESKMSKGHKYGVMTNIFSTIPFVFESSVNDKNDYYKIYGRKNNRRITKWVKREYIDSHENLGKFKMLLPKSNGSGSFGERLGESIVAAPNELHTQTYISFGKFSTKIEVINLETYIKTKFARALLGVLKITQDNKKKVWEKVPLQDFTPNSDIDWTKSIAEIDQQLYKKYGLDEEEINFIESNVKEME